MNCYKVINRILIVVMVFSIILVSYLAYDTIAPVISHYYGKYLETDNMVNLVPMVLIPAAAFLVVALLLSYIKLFRLFHKIDEESMNNCNKSDGNQSNGNNQSNSLFQMSNTSVSNNTKHKFNGMLKLKCIKYSALGLVLTSIMMVAFSVFMIFWTVYMDSVIEYVYATCKYYAHLDELMCTVLYLFVSYIVGEIMVCLLKIYNLVFIHPNYPDTSKHKKHRRVTNMNNW